MDDVRNLGFNLRNTGFTIGANITATVFTGIQKSDNSFGTVHQRPVGRFILA